MKKIAIIGLGYVGLPLAAAFSAKHQVVGFDISTTRIADLKNGRDLTREISPEELAEATQLTSGSTPAIADEVDALYAGIITAGTHKASSIKVAEAAKVIENTQRDLNIALINELAMIFARLDIDTQEVLAAAGTKWNFIPFKPGLVGGHCIGVDPYYLTHKAQAIGYHPEIILAGRRVNDGMGAYVAAELVKAMIKAGHTIAKARVLVMGFTFKENCPDPRQAACVLSISIRYRISNW